MRAGHISGKSVREYTVVILKSHDVVQYKIQLYLNCDHFLTFESFVTGVKNYQNLPFNYHTFWYQGAMIAL